MDSRLLLDRQNAETCNHLLQDSDPSSPILDRFEGITLPGAIEVFAIAARSPNGRRLQKEIRAAVRRGMSPWVEILRAWEGSRTNPIQPFAAQSMEIRRLHLPVNESDLLDDSLFEQRFRRSLIENHFPSEVANIMSLVFHEMIDNAYQHSGEQGLPAPSVAAYRVSAGCFSISVADLGGGFLMSLSKSPEWRHLNNDQEALLAVIHQKASRRFGQGEGRGFDELLKAVADRGARLRIRSQSTVAQVEATTEGRVAKTHRVAASVGVHVSLCCSVHSESFELPCDFN